MENISEQSLHQDIQKNANQQSSFSLSSQSISQRPTTQLIVYQKLSYSLQHIILFCLVGIILMRLQILDLKFTISSLCETIIIGLMNILVILDSLRLQLVENKFKFMKSFKGRAVFYLFLGSFLTSRSAKGILWQRLLGIGIWMYSGLMLFFDFTLMSLSKQESEEQIEKQRLITDKLKSKDEEAVANTQK